MDLTPAEIAHITNYLDVSTPLPDHADLLFVFGTRLLTPAYLATELYLEGRAPYILLCGGANRYTGENEAERHLAVLLEAGVPAERVIVENRSTNTYENVVFALPLIEQKAPLSQIHSVLTVCKWQHSRRAIMTLKRNFPAGVRYYCATYEPADVTRENWPQNPRAQSANVLKNWENIPVYLERGHIAEIQRDGDAWV